MNVQNVAILEFKGIFVKHMFPSWRVNLLLDFSSLDMMHAQRKLPEVFKRLAIDKNNLEGHF